MRQVRDSSIHEARLIGPYGFGYNHQVLNTQVPHYDIRPMSPDMLGGSSSSS